MDKIRILIAEDHPLLRVGLRYMLSNTDDLELIGEVGSGTECVDFVDKQAPDIILMDVGMPEMDGIEAAKVVCESHPDVKVIMLTSHDNDEDIFASLAAGASGYCLKDIAFERLHMALRAVHTGDVWIDSTIASKVLKALPQEAATRAVAAGISESAPAEKVYGSLSEREQSVLRLVVEGLSNKEIADRLVISTETVKTHIRHILEKLAVSDRTQAAVKALRQGLI